MSEYKESKGNFWIPTKKEEKLEGLYTNIESDVGAHNSNIYHIERLSDNESVQVWGSTILDQRMIPVKIGQQVLITYKGLGETKGGKQAPKLFKVEYKDADGVSSDIDEVMGK